MAKIIQLDQNTINKIAAGEVVERPSSVVKELVENAIDAKSSAITIEIKDGGTSLIRITDNGSGISYDDLQMAFKSHATSKIKDVDDLFTIESLGFRGEALSSIAAISQVELITKVRNALMGHRYVIEGGEEKSIEEIGCPEGTTFLVKNIFYNTPVRRKFLKTNQTEAGYVYEIAEHLAISHPDISFKFINNGQVKLHTSGNGNLKDLIYNIYGRDIAGNVIEVQKNTDKISISGFIGKPIVSRSNRNYENYYINGRYVKSSIIYKAIEEAYSPYTMVNKFPFVSLYIHINSELVDINVHPTKMEIRFSEPNTVYQAIFMCLREALEGGSIIPKIELEKKTDKEKVIKKAAEPFEVKRKNNENIIRPDTIKEVKKAVNPFKLTSIIDEDDKNDILKEETKAEVKETEKVKEEIKKEDKEPENLKEDKPVVTEDIVTEEIKDEAESEAEEIKEEIAETEDAKETDKAVITDVVKEEVKPVQQSFFDENSIEHKVENKLRIVGQVFRTYWIFEMDNEMFIIDQHAAHEKVMYEKIMKRLQNETFNSQMVAPPIIVTLNPKEEVILSNNMEVFNKLGFEISSFGGNDYSISAVPQDMLGIADKDLFLELLDMLTENDAKKNPDIVLEKTASMACKAAVKGNNKLSFAEAESLIKEMMQLENPFNCPHGRPTTISLTKNELEKKFKRQV
ncbi:MAG: DNA mismatch repair endonuclease MutL [Lachnospiraceae bacterium]|nr:DNA mismatch repair endonuclease MutL [Lachnospiraceae bacterium]